MFSDDDTIDNAILVGYKVLCGDCDCLTSFSFLSYGGSLCCKCGMNPYKCISNQDKLKEMSKDDILQQQYIKKDTRGFND